MSLSATAGRRRVAAGLLTAGLAVGLLAGMGRGLVSCNSDAPVDPTRPLSVAEAERLATMRLHNARDGGAEVRAAIGTRGAEIRLTGWIDWRQPLAYLAVAGPGTGAEGPARLLQAVPGLVATRTAAAAAATGEPSAAAGPVVDPNPLPPRRAPEDAWRIRPLAPGPGGGATGSVDSLLALLFTLAADEPDAATVLRESPARWLRRDRAAGHEVDVLLGPAVPPPAEPAGGASQRPAPPASLAAMGGAVRYWLDGRARLHRLEALLAPGVPVAVDLTRDGVPPPDPIGLLGGAVDARPVTAAQAQALSVLRQRNQAAGGAEIRVALPRADGGMRRGAGWVSWLQPAVYLAVTDPDGSGRLVRADAAGVATRATPRPTAGGGTGAPAPPPLPPPAGDWRFSAWDERRGSDLDLLLTELLALGGWQTDDPAALRDRAVRLREDAVGGDPVGVYEMSGDPARDARPGTARLRYWVDGTGLLRRLQVRTGTGAFGHLDLDHGAAPHLPQVVNPA